MGLILGVLFINMVPLLSSKTVNFIDLLQSGVLIATSICSSNCISGTFSQRIEDKAMCSAFSVDSAISVYILYFYVMGQFAHLIIKPVLKHADVGSSVLALSQIPTKSKILRMSLDSDY